MNGEVLMQEAEAAQLEQFREWYESGDNKALILAVRFCMKQRIAAPDWARDAFIEATNRWFGLECRELGEALGLEWPRGKHLHAARKRQWLQPLIYEKVRAAVNGGTALDDQLFEKLARQLHSNKTDVKEIWQEMRRNLHPIYFLFLTKGRKKG